MSTADDYSKSGYALLERFVPPEVASGLLERMKTDLARQGISFAQLETAGPLLKSKAPELYGYHYPILIAFLWGMTPAIEVATGRSLLPTYSYFRLYRKGDICRIHGDRPSCEHSISLTLAYSDGIAWPLDISRTRHEKPIARADDCFAPHEDVASLPMKPGDAVLYQGVSNHHGRSMPNPNRWSAHLFLHWVSRDGPYAGHAFDGRPPPESVDIQL